MIYLISIGFFNLYAFILMFIDKRKAIKNKRRIPEKTLFISALMGGSLGVWLAMYSFRHKTQHASFYIGVPVIIMAQLLVLSYVLGWINL